MKEEWKEVEFECFAKDKDGFDVPVKGVFKCRYGESVEAVLVSLKDGNGRNVEVSAGERERIENDCAWHEYKNEYGSVGLSKEKNVKIAKELVKLAKSLVVAGYYDDDDDIEYGDWRYDDAKFDSHHGGFRDDYDYATKKCRKCGKSFTLPGPDPEYSSTNSYNRWRQGADEIEAMMVESTLCRDCAKKQLNNQK